MQIVVGVNLRNPHPRVWDPQSPYFLPQVRALMVSFAEISGLRGKARQAITAGLHAYLKIPPHIHVYLDNGAFSFFKKGKAVEEAEYLAFVEKAKPDWYAIPRDVIPSPAMGYEAQKVCFEETMDFNHRYSYDGFVPVMHVSQLLGEYLTAFNGNEKLAGKPFLAIGGIVPNLLRAPQAMSYQKILHQLRQVREAFPDKKIHLFGVGGTATVHLAALLGMDSIDSAGWRNRAARGIVQLPGKGDRYVANLGKWRGRIPTEEEWQQLAQCACPACSHAGTAGLKADKLAGFCHRATHNLWVLLEEARLVQAHLYKGTYRSWYVDHVSNSTYGPLIDYLVAN